MSTSRENSVIPRGRWVFEDTQKNWLAKCDVDGRVRPGGSPYMGDDTTAFEALDWLTRQPARFGLAMDIDVQPREFWRFEPVQLDLCLQTITSRNLTLPDEIDPGYKRLRVFIEDGNGERWLYRSPVIFCRAQRTRTIGRTAFQRDLPLFGQAGGYTFRRSGTHRIHVELELPNHSVLRSNILEVRVKPDALSDPTWNAGRNLQNKRIGKLLFHKNDLRDGKGLRLLDEWLNNHSQNKLGSIGTVQYLWSAVALRRSTRKTSEAGKHLREMALERLRRAEQSSGLGDHRRRRIRDLFAEYERPIFRSAPRSSRKTRRTRISHRRS